eukprot:Skav207028  [mRNA]  locus=scaffold2740:321168:321760:+ [translate_table: standard]
MLIFGSLTLGSFRSELTSLVNRALSDGVDMTSSLPPYENLNEYFDELTNPAFSETLRTFFELDAHWKLLQEPHQALAGSKEANAQRFQSSAKFVHDLLSAFGYNPVCNICPGQDSRCTYASHVCGSNHFKFLYEKVRTDSRGRDMNELKRGYWQSWTFVLGEARRRL